MNSLGWLIGEINLPSSPRRIQVFCLAKGALSQEVVVNFLKELHNSAALAASRRHLLFRLGILARIGSPLHSAEALLAHPAPTLRPTGLLVELT
jgi:hypothetical protein